MLDRYLYRAFESKFRALVPSLELPADQRVGQSYKLICSKLANVINYSSSLPYMDAMLYNDVLNCMRYFKDNAPYVAALVPQY